MLIGLATLISILFFGGVSESFLVDKLEKGARKHIIEKDRRKEILADLKVSKDYIKAFNKKRNDQLKAFKEMNANKAMDRDDFESFFAAIIEERKEFQKYVIAERVKIAEKIEPDEWTLMMAMSSESVDKRRAKEEKKITKGKIGLPFAETRDVISEKVELEGHQANLREALDNFLAAETKIIDELAAMNVQDNKVLKNKNATSAELHKIAEKLNAMRMRGYNNLIDFHFTARDNASGEAWDALMKAFNKELTLTPH